jgi:hypothetical protein
MGLFSVFFVGDNTILDAKLASFTTAVRTGSAPHLVGHLISLFERY